PGVQTCALPILCPWSSTVLPKKREGLDQLLRYTDTRHEGFHSIPAIPMLGPKGGFGAEHVSQDVARIELAFRQRVAFDDIHRDRNQESEPDSLSDHDSKILDREIT